MEIGQPVDLQQHCFLYLLAHLEEFPPATLALLPQRMRQELLLMLPAADILQLEQTGVVDGVDMDEIWELVCQRYQLSLPFLSLVQPKSQLYDVPVGSVCWRILKPHSCSLSMKEYFLVIVCSLLFHVEPVDVLVYVSEYQWNTGRLQNNYVGVLQYLFSTKLYSRREIKAHRGIPLVHVQQVVRPARFEHFIGSPDCSCTAFQLMEFMIEKLKVRPKGLMVSSHNFIASPFWEELIHSVSKRVALKQFLSEVREVEFLTEPYKEAAKPIYLMLETILTSKNPQLESLVIGVNEFRARRRHGLGRNGKTVCRAFTGPTLRDILVTISPLLEAKVSAPGSPSSDSPSPQSYQGLKKLHITTKYKGESTSAYAVATEQFIRIAQNQRHLEFVYTSGWLQWSEKYIPHTAFETLCSITSRLSLFHLRNMDLPAPLVQALIQSFLSSNSFRKCELVLSSVWMYDDPKATSKFAKWHKHMPPEPATTADESGLAHKSLRLLSMYIPNPFIQWLSTLHSVRLHMLELSNLQYDYNMMHGGVLGVLGQHPNCHITHVRCSNHTQDCPQEGVNWLLQDFGLQTLHFGGAKKDMLDCLAVGLVNQGRVGSLRCLTLVRNKFYPETQDSDFKKFFTALFSLPQLEELTFELRETHLKFTHLATLYYAWKEKGNGKKLRRLFLDITVSGDAIDFRQEFLSYIATESDLQILQYKI